MFYRSLCLFILYIAHQASGLNVELSVTQKPRKDVGYVDFNCKAELEPSATVEYYKVVKGKETLLGSNDKFYQEIPGNVLSFIYDRTDDGLYLCKVHQGGQTWTSKPVFFYFRSKPKIDVIPKDGANLVVGQDFERFCNASGIPASSITWTKNGDSFRSDGEYLRLKSVTKEDSGEYLCLADNGSGYTTIWSISVDVVFYPPTITKFEVENGNGSLALIRCFVDGGRTPTVFFLRQTENGRMRIETDESKYVITVESLNDEPKDSNMRRWVLSIKDLEPNDNGTYYCVAKNEVGKVEEELVLTETPYITQIPSDRKHFEMGQDFETFCNAFSIPAPSITWTKKGSSFRSEGKHLRLTSITKEDSGTYICTADNGLGDSAQWEIVVDVVFYPPIITEVEVIKGHGGYTLLNCIVDGGPSPSVSFWKQTANGRVKIVIDWDKYVIVAELLYDEPWDSNKRKWFLSMNDPDPSGTYYCVAENKLGKVEKKLVLTDALTESG